MKRSCNIKLLPILPDLDTVHWVDLLVLWCQVGKHVGNLYIYTGSEAGLPAVGCFVCVAVIAVFTENLVPNATYSPT